MQLNDLTPHRSAVKACALVCILLLLFEVTTQAAQAVANFLYTHPLPLKLEEPVSWMMMFVILNIPLVLAEYFAPGTRAKRHYWHGIKCWFAAIAFGYYWAQLTQLVIAQLHIIPLLKWSPSLSTNHLITNLMTIVLPLILFDLLYYWLHRAQHRYAWLWQFHQVHHSITHMNCFNSYHHWLEDVARFVCISLPLLFVIQVDTPNLAILSAAISTWGWYIHSDTKIHLGKANTIVADNRFHRIHHSLKEEHYDKNFAAFFPVWDWVFGTYHSSVTRQLPAVGLTDTQPPRSVMDYLWIPFRRDDRPTPSPAPSKTI